jgi:hypothetical protein
MYNFNKQAGQIILTVSYIKLNKVKFINNYKIS